MLLLQGDVGLEATVVEASRRSGRSVQGMMGPLALVERARRALGFERRATSRDGAQILWGVDLDDLVLPSLAHDRAVDFRAPTPVEFEEVVVPWRVDYYVEALGRPRTPELLELARQELANIMLDTGVLVHHELLVSLTGFNAKARGIVQVGGVWTPPPLRGRGYARAAVARSLQAARAEGARRSVLFAHHTNAPANRAYVSLGYQRVGDFALVLFA